MGYQTPIGGISRTLASNVFMHSSSFTRFNLFNFGARMSVLKLSPDNYVIYSAIPYDDTMIKSLTSEIQDPEWLSKVSHVIIPDREHCMGVKSYEGKLSPSVQIIGMETTREDVNKLINIKIDDKLRDKVMSEQELSQLGITDQKFLNTLKLIYVPSHLNKELLLFDSVSNTLFTGDFFFNFQHTNTFNYKYHNEQFGGKSPASGLSFIIRYLQPYSSVGQYMMKKMSGDNENAKKLVQLLYNLKFENLVMCHGDVIESKGFEVFKTGYKSFFSN